MSRRVDRRHVFCLTFQLGFFGEAGETVPFKEFSINPLFDSYMEAHAEASADSEFIFKEFSGVYQNLGEIDGILSKALKAWTLDRLNKADLAILRIGVYEMLYADEIPASVAINEAVELAKVYCEDTSPGSVNAILGQVLKGMKQV